MKQLLLTTVVVFALIFMIANADGEELSMKECNLEKDKISKNGDLL